MGYYRITGCMGLNDVFRYFNAGMYTKIIRESQINKSNGTFA